MNEITLKLDSPITEEQFDDITDVDFDHTDRIWFHTKHGKDVEFVKPRKGIWCMTPDGKLVCSCCYENPTNRIIVNGDLIYDMTPIGKRMKFCPNCGADLRGDINVNE